MAKTKRMKAIGNVRQGKRDLAGHLILNVLASGNEYAIYEIDTPVPENRLRVQIDGFTDVSEARLIARYNMVKQNYILAKGLLYRSTNFNLMKNRVAHALATTFSSDDPDPNKIFLDLIDEIHNEYKEVIKRRLYFILPSYILLAFLTANSLRNIYCPNYLSSETITYFLKFAFATVVGAVISITYSVRKLTFETEPSKWFYFLLGWERLSLSLLAAIVVFVGVKSKIAFGEQVTSNQYGVLFTGFVAGFFESFVPSLLKKQYKE